MNQEHAGVIVCRATVVRAASYRDQLVRAELVDGVQWVLMAPHNHTDLVLFEEFVDDVRPVRHNVILLLWVAHHVSLHALNFIGRGRVTPHDVHAHLLDCVRDSAQGDPKRPLDLVNIFQLGNRITDSTVNAQDSVLVFLLKKGTKRHPFEQIIHLLEDTVWIVDILVEPLSALLTET